MTHARVRFWFCIAVALIAAAVADPLVELASNAGLFGPGDFTDHSNWDVLPTLAIGLSFAAFYVALRVRQMLDFARQRVSCWLNASPNALAGRTLFGLLPAVYATQIATLYVMETTEQLVVRGHVLGGTIWLGGPIAISLAVHALFCVAATFCIGWILRLLAQTALRIVRLVLALGTYVLRNAGPVHFACEARVVHRYASPVPCRIGERGPPLVLA